MLKKPMKGKKQQAHKPGGPPRNMDKATAKRYYGNTELHYLKTCTHDVRRNGLCSFCKIIEKEAQKYLSEERAKKDLQRQHGFYRRAEMRYGLVREWSKNQLFRNRDVLQTHSAEIVLCSKLGDSIGHFDDINKALDDIALNLRKRNRVLEVGDFAAILIQARIRGHLTRKRTRHYMLTRFQYNAANTRRKAYFFDHEKGSRWKEAPALIKNERPVSPTTMARRLRSENKKCEGHMIKFENACKRSESYLHQKRGGLWKVLEEDAMMLRQMIILRDVIYCVLTLLNAKRRDAGERPVNKKSILPLGGPKGPHPSEVQPPATARVDTESPEVDENGDDIVKPKKVVKKRTNRYKRGESTGDGLQKSESTVGESGAVEEEKKGGHDYTKHLTALKPTSSAFPYWFCFSNPAPPVRQIYLTLALKTPPLPTEVVVELSPAEIAAQLKAEQAAKVVITAESLDSKGKSGRVGKDQGGKDSSVLKAAPQVDEEITEEEMEEIEKRKNPNALTLNERFQFLEKRIWSQMICFDAEDILRKVAMSEDVHPAVCSGAGIAEDEHKVWCGDVLPGGDIPGIKARGLKVVNDDTDDESSIQYSATDSDESETNSASATPRDVQGNEPDPEKEMEGSIIPIQLQVHPLVMHREPTNMFRLFFIKGVLRAVCHTSPWTYYSDIWTYKASVVKATANFSRSLPCVEIIKALTQNSRDKSLPKEKSLKAMPSFSRMNSLGKSPSLSRMGSMSASSSNLMGTVEQGSCMSVRLPDERVIFDGKPEMKSAPLTSKEYKRIEQSYGFLKRMFSWKKYKRQTKRHVDYESFQPEMTLSIDELQRQESVASTLAGGTDADRKVNLMPPPEELMGSTIYKLCCSQVPQYTLSEAAKQKLVNYSGTNGYRSLLKRNVNTGETLMEHCLALPEANGDSQDLPSEIPAHPDFNLIVLEVYLKDNRAEDEEKLRKLEEESGIVPLDSKKTVESSSRIRRTSSLKGGKLPAIKDKKLKSQLESKVPLVDYQVELHHVVGTFSTSSERPPASLDTGMFNWEDFKCMAAPPPQEEAKEEIPVEEMSAFQISQFEKQRKAVPEWLSYDKSPQSGIFTYNASMTTARTQQAAPDDKHMIEFRMLGRRPTREHLQSVVPLKIRKWVGMKY